MATLRGSTMLGIIVASACATPSTPNPTAPPEHNTASSPAGTAPGVETPQQAPPKSTPPPKPQAEPPALAQPTTSADRPFAHLPAPPGVAQQRAMPVSAASDPYGDPKGWEGARKPGDPWATSVMAALNTVSFPTEADSKLVVKSTLQVCKDGSIKPTLLNTSGSTALDDDLLAQLRNTSVPPPPPKVQAKMKGACAKLRYRFLWSSAGVR